jgi:hypothetical protein
VAIAASNDMRAPPNYVAGRAKKIEQHMIWVGFGVRLDQLDIVASNATISCGTNSLRIGDLRKNIITFNEADLAALTSISKRTWQKHRLFGRGPRFYRLGGAVRYDLPEVLEWIKSHGVGQVDDRGLKAQRSNSRKPPSSASTLGQ